jgi:peptide/nickel transport system substrate-binding protein
MTWKVVSAVAVATLVLVACGGGGSSSTSSSPGAQGGGGVFRTAVEGFGFTDGFDPTGEYLGAAWGLQSELLLRTLVTYDHVAGLPGDKIVPDVASKWTTSSDGLTWTFTLKSGVMFGPPLNRAVTSKDFAFAFQRINTASLVAQYGNYYAGVIEGLDGKGKSQTDPVSGIETPNDSTLILHLTNPTGDLLNRLAMPATAAMPPEVAGCFNKPKEYGADIIATGPYMLQGEDQLDVTSCSTIKPISGYEPGKHMIFVKNPAYDASTDSTADRGQTLNGVTITIDTNTDDIFNKIQSGDLDGSWQSNPSGTILQQYVTDPNLKDNIHSDSSDTTYYITMNMLVPPFDDVHVRKAVNLVLDKAQILKTWGGSLRGSVAHTVEPATVNPATADYNPYPSPNDAGDLQAAMDEIKQSKYDTNGDGKCDPDVCSNLLMVSRNFSPWTDMDPVIVANLAKIGIDVKLRELDTTTAYTTIQTVKNLVPIAANARWGKDYPDPYGFDFFPFTTAGILCTGQTNYSEMGMTAATARECGVLDQWNAATDNGKNPLPSADAQMKKCYGVAAGDARYQCFAGMDKYIMETGVPWAPYIIGNQITTVADTVTHYEFDQFSGFISFAHVQVNNGLTVDQVSV